jgi:hypothetical protein
MRNESLYDIPPGCICQGDGLLGMPCYAKEHARLKKVAPAPLFCPITDRDVDIAERVFFWTLAAVQETARETSTSSAEVIAILLKKPARASLRKALEEAGLDS